mmetsp:Transcript_120255/g.208758  ORF Transcript_120255/g.208758 Transcript_120255/m.208758 type:complete len:83 (+) Transcript_120255:125-373(+)
MAAESSRRQPLPQTKKGLSKASRQRLVARAEAWRETTERCTFMLGAMALLIAAGYWVAWRFFGVKPELPRGLTETSAEEEAL